jgi:Family of unknown function (DUF6893)
MKVVITLGSDASKSSGAFSLLKLFLLGLAALAVLSRNDIRRYFRLRNM